MKQCKLEGNTNKNKNIGELHETAASLGQICVAISQELLRLRKCLLLSFESNPGSASCWIIPQTIIDDLDSDWTLAQSPLEVKTTLIVSSYIQEVLERVSAINNRPGSNGSIKLLIAGVSEKIIWTREDFSLRCEDARGAISDILTQTKDARVIIIETKSFRPSPRKAPCNPVSHSE